MFVPCTAGHLIPSSHGVIRPEKASRMTIDVKYALVPEDRQTDFHSAKPKLHLILCFYNGSAVVNE